VQIEGDPQAVQALSWVREMYAFSLAAAAERLALELAAPPNSTLIIQPPYDLRMGRATQVQAGAAGRRSHSLCACVCVCVFGGRGEGGRRRPPLGLGGTLQRPTSPQGEHSRSSPPLL
jgi:hypothetical protein